jgi:hypothetical protein
MLQSQYVELLAAFVGDLSEQGIRVLFLPVNGHLALHPVIREFVAALDSAGTVELIDIESWFGPNGPIPSPEGHEWGSGAHRIIGTNLARHVTKSVAHAVPNSN